MANLIPLDRSEVRRLNEDALASARVDPQSQFLVFDNDRALLRGESSEPAILSGSDLRDAGCSTDGAVLLGFDNRVAWFAVDLHSVVSRSPGRFTERGVFASLGPMDDPIDRSTWGLLAQASALLAWNRLAAHCPACGAPTVSRYGGYQRKCRNPSCAKTHFPRTDPAVIVRVLHADGCLLARTTRFRPHLRSVLAGFVEPGESLEETVHREILEEVGIEVNDLRYLGSQPWPFPMSLMIAFEAHAMGTELRIDPREIEQADWYTRERIVEEVADGRLLLPSRKSIARQMIDGWLSRNEAI